MRKLAGDAIPFDDLGNASELAPQTPLTREAVIHVRAAAGEVGRAFPQLVAILGAIKRGLYNPVVGDDLTLDSDTVFDLRELCDVAVDIADHKLQRPIFARGRGERPHGGAPDSETAITLYREDED